MPVYTLVRKDDSPTGLGVVWNGEHTGEVHTLQLPAGASEDDARSAKLFLLAFTYVDSCVVAATDWTRRVKVPARGDQRAIGVQKRIALVEKLDEQLDLLSSVSHRLSKMASVDGGSLTIRFAASPVDLELMIARARHYISKADAAYASLDMCQRVDELARHISTHDRHYFEPLIGQAMVDLQRLVLADAATLKDVLAVRIRFDRMVAQRSASINQRAGAAEEKQ